jgi:hypothetical protein
MTREMWCRESDCLSDRSLSGEIGLEFRIKPDERGLKVPCSATELPAQPGWSLRNLFGSRDLNTLAFRTVGTLGSPGEVEGSGEGYHEGGQDSELEHQVQEPLRADGLFRLSRHEQDAPDYSYEPDQEERFGDDLPLPDDYADGVQQLDEDEDQEHSVEDRERRVSMSAVSSGSALIASTALRAAEAKIMPTVSIRANAAP